MTLEKEVVDLVAELGWRRDERGGFVLRAPRTTYRASARDLVAFARRLGLPALRAKLEADARALRRDSSRNAFRERRLARVLPGVVADRVAETLGRVTVTRLDGDGRPLKPGKPNR